MGDDVYALNSARDAVFVWPWANFGSGGYWTQVRSGTSYMQLVGGPSSQYWATSEPGEEYFWPSGSVFGQFADGYDFAVTRIRISRSSRAERRSGAGGRGLGVGSHRRLPGGAARLGEQGVRHEVPERVSLRGAPPLKAGKRDSTVGA